ncbi:MAG: DUF2332 family protein, partial [Vicinamibacteraceae bacterium]
SWLMACIWPEHETRRQRLIAAAAVVAADPPRLIRGDLVTEIDAAIESAPADTTVVVFHSAMLNYVDAHARGEFAERLSGHRDVVWLSNEAPKVIATISTELKPPAFANTATYFVVGRDGSTPLALSDPHGSWLAGA